MLFYVELKLKLLRSFILLKAFLCRYIHIPKGWVHHKTNALQTTNHLNTWILSDSKHGSIHIAFLGQSIPFLSYYCQAPNIAAKLTNATQFWLGLEPTTILTTSEFRRFTNCELSFIVGLRI